MKRIVPGVPEGIAEGIQKESWVVSLEKFQQEYREKSLEGFVEEIMLEVPQREFLEAFYDALLKEPQEKYLEESQLELLKESYEAFLEEFLKKYLEKFLDESFIIFFVEPPKGISTRIAEKSRELLEGSLEAFQEVTKFEF